MTPALLLSLLLTAPGDPFVATGEVLLEAGGSSSSAAFDAGRVVGPRVNLTRMEGGGWSGQFRQHPVALVVSDTHLAAPNLDLYLERTGDGLAIRGHAFGRRYSLVYGPKGLTGRAGACSVDLKVTPEGPLSGEIGCPRDGRLPSVSHAALKLQGQAGQPSPPMPQLALALLSVFP